MSDAAAEEVQLAWPDRPLVRISAPEASMAVSVETETIDRWVPAGDVDVWPNVANGEDQQDPVRMVPAVEDPDVPCRGNKSDGILYMEGRNLHIQMVERGGRIEQTHDTHRRDLKSCSLSVLTLKVRLLKATDRKEQKESSHTVQ